MVRNIVFYKDSFLKFYYRQEPKVQEKAEYVLEMIRYELKVPTKFFKPLKNTRGICEVRVITATKSIRILGFIDSGNIVVLTNCFLKKTQKTPKKEIAKAQSLRERYYANK